MARIANGESLLCRAYLGNEDIEVRPTFDQRLTAYKELAQYVAPKRKAVEHSGSIGTHEERLEDLHDLDNAQ
ncbi:hypothetical protein [Limnoglobus roseus]|uniref:hypothetical protein n=1 Tax=Limnoglobus roseus TaxID=2598579 RepID=UPI0011EB5A5E|nr:hypothetical protein [Limnoglobus roseus]